MRMDKWVIYLKCIKCEWLVVIVYTIYTKKGIASSALNKHSKLLTNKTLPLLRREIYRGIYYQYFFLYQCGTWILKDKLKYKIYVFQRLFLKTIVGIRHYNKSNNSISNKEFYKKKVTNSVQFHI